MVELFFSPTQLVQTHHLSNLMVMEIVHKYLCFLLTPNHTPSLNAIYSPQRLGHCSLGRGGVRALEHDKKSFLPSLWRSIKGLRKHTPLSAWVLQLSVRTPVFSETSPNKDSGGRQIPLLDTFRTWNQDSTPSQSLSCSHQCSLFVPSRKSPPRGHINLSNSPALIRTTSQHPHFLSYLNLSIESNESYPIVRL